MSMRLKVDIIGEGLHPSEAVVAIRTVDGTERLRVARRSISNGMIEVGGPTQAQKGAFLVELPRETQRGAWRVWVDQDQVEYFESERLRA